jgi:hypothetical protein
MVVAFTNMTSDARLYGGNIGAMNKTGRTKFITEDRNFTDSRNLFNSELQRQAHNQTKMSDSIYTFFASYHVPLPNTGTFAANLDEASITKNLASTRYGGVVNLASLGPKESQIGFSTQNYQGRLPTRLFQANNKTSSSSQTDPMPLPRTVSNTSTVSPARASASPGSTASSSTSPIGLASMPGHSLNSPPPITRTSNRRPSRGERDRAMQGMLGAMSGTSLSPNGEVSFREFDTQAPLDPFEWS